MRGLRLVLLACALGGSASAQNLVFNPSFETSVSGWSMVNARIERVSLPDAPDGTWAARLTCGSAEGYCSLDDTHALVDGTPSAGLAFHAAARVRAASAVTVGRRLELTFRELSRSGETLRVASGAVNLTRDFQPVEVDTVTQGAGNFLDLYLIDVQSEPGDSFEVDRISVTSPAFPAAAPPPQVDVLAGPADPAVDPPAPGCAAAGFPLALLVALWRAQSRSSFALRRWSMLCRCWRLSPERRAASETFPRHSSISSVR